jgi:putative hydrolase of the HAD superfamily
MALRGVLFDLGGTLLHYTPVGLGWEDMEKIGAQGVYRYLLSRDFTLPPEPDALSAAWEFARNLWTSLSLHDVTQLKLGIQLGRMAEQWGVRNLSPDVLDDLAVAYMQSVQSHVRPLDGALDVLRTLHELGVRIGLISNTTWPGASHRGDLDRYGLMAYFDHLVFSADADLWKPEPEVFQHCLSALKLAPQDAVFVGDSLYFDVWGAQQVGMRGVWLEQPHAWVPDGIEVKPDAIIRGLPELITIVNAWRV